MLDTRPDKTLPIAQESGYKTKAYHYLVFTVLLKISIVWSNSNKIPTESPEKAVRFEPTAGAFCG